ncbi:MFS family protein [Helicobacter mustelae]|uniref:NTP/NDP exchange transporter n=1 Tax=Helicobacter mustelae TaxID=217 RepID=UPI000DFBD220|nr:MFS transporter [Helicobacter mustelae]STP12912.1 MFS family protein [Helicobacter mustelae]
MQKIQNFKIFHLKPGEWKLLVMATSFIFLLFFSYAILRPIRDSLGLSGGSMELKWLFFGTFIATVVGSILAMVLSTRIQRKHYVNGIFLFFITNLVGFFIAFRIWPHESEEFLWLSRIFFIWVSIFNLFIISSAWSLMADVFTKDCSQRLFGIISAGASLGSVLGASSVSLLATHLGNNTLLLLSVILLSLSLLCKDGLIKSAYALLENKEERAQFSKHFSQSIGSKNPFIGFSLIIRSPYLLGILAFILLLTSVSTFLYMEQARIVRELFVTREQRAAAFANIDLIVQIVSFLIQIFFTATLAKSFGIKGVLGILGFVVGIGFIVLIFTHPAFFPMVVIMSIRRIGEYAFIKPGREMLFVPLDSDSKYKVKSFLDTVVYRGGDALSAQVEGMLSKIGISAALGFGAFLAFAWGALGIYLGKKYEKVHESSQES